MARKGGWDGPLEVEYDISPSAVLAAILRYVPVRTGALAASIKVRKDRKKGYVGVEVSSPLPYARPLNDGAWIPPVEGKLMVFEKNGEKVYTMKRRGYYLRGRHFVEMGLDAVLAEDHSDAITARWTKRRY